MLTDIEPDSSTQAWLLSTVLSGFFSEGEALGFVDGVFALKLHGFDLFVGAITTACEPSPKYALVTISLP